MRDRIGAKVAQIARLTHDYEAGTLFGFALLILSQDIEVLALWQRCVVYL